MILKDKIALITGAGGEIGGDIARFFVSEGCRVLAVGRSLDSLNRLKEKLNDSVEIFMADVSKPEDVRSLMDFADKTFGRLDILVTAAGTYGEIGSIEQCDPEKWLTAIKINLFGTILSVKYALPLLKKSKKAKILTFAGGGEGAMPNFTSYVASKGAVLRFTESVAKELEKYGIEINAISPGLVNSGLARDLIRAGEEKAGKDKFEETVAQTTGKSKTVSPEKAAALAVWLASENSDGLTGKNISAVWDNYKEIPKHIAEIAKSDIYNFRRVKPKDRGYDW